jgi:putative heme iron utilization protein
MLDDLDKHAIIAHMNTDHADAVLLYAQMLAGYVGAQTAVLERLEETSMALRVEVLGSADPILLEVALPEAIRSSADARRVLIKLARQARDLR